MERVLVIGASGGIGGAMAAACRARGADVVGLSRSQDGLDVTDPESVERVLGALDGAFDLIFVATGRLDGAGRAPEKGLRALSAEALVDQFRINAMGPALVLRHAPRLLSRDRRGVLACLSARVGSIGDNRLGGWYSYRAAKAALNQLLHGAALEIARTHPEAIVLALHPGTVATPFTEGYARDKLTPEESAAALLDVIAARGPGDSGGFYDWKGEVVPW
ncbi:MAG: SDR family NAD(P)-dependent oxidoreductase [Shimia sp.]